MKRLIIIAGTLLLVGVFATIGLASGQGKGKDSRSMGQWQGDQGYSSRYVRWNDDLTDEQRNQLKELHQKFYDETAQLRTEMLAKSGELNILLNTSNPDAEKAKALQKNVSDLSGKMALERLNFQIEARKIAPDFRFGMGSGKGHRRNKMKGLGQGMGYGLNMGGQGPGSCWN